MTQENNSGALDSAVDLISPTNTPDNALPPSSEKDISLEEQVAQEQSTDSQETQEEQETAQAKRRRLGGFQKKLAQKDAQIAQLEAALATMSAGKAAPAPETVSRPSQKPRPEDFQTYDEYVEALTDYKTEQAIAKVEDKKRSETVQQAHNRRLQEAEQRYDDFHEVLGDYNFSVLPGLAQQAVLHSEKGADVAYYIASNPEVGDRLARLSDIQAALEIGKIEAHLEAKSNQKTVKSAVKVTKAPPPITPVSTKHVGSKDLKSMSYKEYYQAQGYDKI